MSWNPSHNPECTSKESLDALETLIIPRSRDLGGFSVRRALPSVERQMVGPFIFFDHMGPAEMITGSGIDVRPHPHIGLGTVTYLYRGEFRHQDSLGTDQMIYPGEVNWMVAGKAITHSERTTDEVRANPHHLHGIQTWIALPEEHEDMDPSFEHRGKEELPFLDDGGVEARVILGTAFGERSPVKVLSETFYVDAVLEPGAKMPLENEHEDRGIYVTRGSITIAGDTFVEGQMMVFRPGDELSLQAGEQGARIMMLGGATLGGPRYVTWNFVSSSKEKIEHAKEEWSKAKWGEGMFDLPPTDRDEFIPYP